ncbi:hypothetical protein FACS1894167_06950 [Synergistales bacterium]|nr:hypothetical protein FACS1894167_06950 [Synergistales bacterium]
MAKKTLIFAIVGVVVLICGMGGAYWLGTGMRGNKNASTEVKILDPGPMVELGQFTSSLADPDPHIIKVKVTAELNGVPISERLQTAPGWDVTMKDLVLKTLKEQRYDDVRLAEGMESLKQELKTRLNAILPKDDDGNAAVRRILFDEYLTQ